MMRVPTSEKLKSSIREGLAGAAAEMGADDFARQRRELVDRHNQVNAG